MTTAFACAIVLLLTNTRALASEAEYMSESFIKSGVVPDVIPEAPSALANVVYRRKVKVSLGNELRPSQMTKKPFVDWDADMNSFYTLAMVDPDVPSRAIPLLREFLHWLVGNIPGDDVKKGEPLAVYVSPTPPPGSGPHRYVYLIYEQPERVFFYMTPLDSTMLLLRANFSINNFAMKYNLGKPLFGNFCQAQVLSSNI